ncbi:MULTISPECIES: HD domain-containing phosphohydrolase [unclassified Xanthobacter]|uniref:HD domain-containing phosphohydrolase n=1 Tax=unclassified Xanthobacter TaxID=2623496 RepID=UPI001EE090C7|nr:MULTISPECIES: HD domain-containing phosphohydrolase [unclassified Xanthobacter]
MTSAVLMWQGWQAARAALFSSAQETSIYMGRLIDEKAQGLLASATFTLDHLAHDPVVTAATLDQRLQRLAAFADTLQKIPFLTSAYVGYDNGEFLLLRPLRTPDARQAFAPPADAAFLVQSITRDGQGQTVNEWRFYTEALQLVETRPQPPTGFDPRTRPWYRDARKTPGRHLTLPYVFFTTGQVGVTLSQHPQGDAVVAIDMELSELSAYLAGQRMTPRTEIALTNSDGTLLAYPDDKRLIATDGAGPHLRALPDLAIPALTRLASPRVTTGRATTFEVGDETWFGIKLKMGATDANVIDLLIAIPETDLLRPIREGLNRQMGVAGGFAALLLVVGWVGATRLGKDLSDLSLRAQRLQQFDFSRPLKSLSLISEVRQLETVLNEVCTTVENFLTTIDIMGSESRLERMIGQVLHKVVAASGCTFGAVYLLNSSGDMLELTALAQDARADQTDEAAHTPPVIPDPQLPLSAIAPGHPPIGELPPGTTQVVLPLLDRNQRPLGLLLLDHPVNSNYAGRNFQTFIERLSGALSTAIETRRLMEAQKDLLDGFIQLIADAIDAKSPYTGGHCRRVPQLATMLADRMSRERSGPYADFNLDEEQRYAFHLGAWLHDCGKVTSPEHVIDKATKLETIHNRIHEVRTRFEVLWRDAEIAHLQRHAAGADPATSARERDAVQARLADDFAFVAQCNVGGEFMTDAAIARLNAIAAQTWTRHLSDRLGLSRAEEARLATVPEAPLPASEPLLADRPEHQVPWGPHRPPVTKDDPANTYGFDMVLPALTQNAGELHNLAIRRGTLNDEERFKVNDHIVQTYVMLQSLPWPDGLKRVPEIAATHHERLDGKGYPRHLGAADLTTEDRVMALADVFEALTAADRPYKPAKTLSDSLRIMAGMAREGHLDPVLFRYFLESRLWETYATRFLRPEQMDVADVTPFLDPPAKAG